MKFAIIPWADEFAKDKMFDDSLHRDGIAIPYIKMRDEFIRLGHDIHTIDYYESLDNVDYFLFFVLDWAWLLKLIRNGYAYKMVYCNAEPPAVDLMNTPSGFKILKNFFPYILTWNDDWIDNINIFKRNIPYYFDDYRRTALRFEEKKLLTIISGNNYSDFPGELYSERRRAIAFFEKKCPEQFDFYGMGWDSDHGCYKGVADSKFEVYNRYKFAICYENVGGYAGYITEKLLDCLVSGIVPIYAGASNILDYVPENAFISLDKFENYEELYQYISSVSKEEYQGYLDSANEFFNSDKTSFFKGEKYAEWIIAAVEHKKRFKISLKGYSYLFRRWLYTIRKKIRLT